MDFNPVLGRLCRFANVRRETLKLKPQCPELRVRGQDGEILVLPRAAARCLHDWCEANGLTGVTLLCGSQSDKWYVKAAFHDRIRVCPLDRFTQAKLV